MSEERILAATRAFATHLLSFVMRDDLDGGLNRAIGFCAAVCHLHGPELADVAWRELIPGDTMAWSETRDPDEEE